MRLRLTEPSRVVVDQEVTSVQAEDESGRFGIRNGHERFLTALTPSVLAWRYIPEKLKEEEERFAAVRGGVLRVDGEGVYVAARSVHISADLDDLEQMIRKAREAQSERNRSTLTSLYQMQIGAWRRLMEYEDAPG